MWKLALVLGNCIGLFTSPMVSALVFLVFSLGFFLTTRRYQPIFVLAMMILWTKVCWQWQVNQQLSSPMLQQPVTLTGVVTQVLQHDATRARFIFQTQTINGESYHRQLLLGWYRDSQSIEAGQRWQFNAKLKNPHRYANPGSFDYESYLFSQGVVAVGNVQGKSAVMLEHSWRYAPLGVWREAVIRHVKKTLHTDTTWLLALIFGDRQQLDPRWQLVLRQTGTNHLLSISGLHIGMIASLIYIVLRYTWALVPRFCFLITAPQAGAVGGLIVAVIYAWLAGFSLSTQRSLLMLAVVLWSALSRQASHLGSRLSFALAFLLVIEPFSILQSGFVLSFFAVFLLWYGCQNRLGRGRDWSSWLRPQVVMTVGLIPVSVYYFQQISLLSLLANMIAIPWVELAVLPLLLFTAFMTFLWPAAATLALMLSNALLNGLFVGLEMMARWIPAYGSASFNSVGALVWVTIGALLLVAPRGFPARRLSLLYFLPLFLHPESTVPKDEFWVTQLDVGQGNATVVLTAHHTLLFDAGPPGFPMIVPFLEHYQRSRVDKVIISHGDADHRGGLAALQASLPIDSIMTSESRWVKVWHATLCQRGQHWEWDGVEFTILHPPTGRVFAKTNEGSCVLQIRQGKRQVLLTGDIQSLAEAYLVADYGEGLRSDILLAPHHGSKTSSGASFIETVQPKWVIMSTGYGNRFHFPHPSVVQRYQAIHANVLNTADCGAMAFKVSKKDIKTSCYREELMRFYRN